MSRHRGQRRRGRAAAVAAATVLVTCLAVVAAVLLARSGSTSPAAERRSPSSPAASAVTTTFRPSPSPPPASPTKSPAPSVTPTPRPSPTARPTSKPTPTGTATAPGKRTITLVNRLSQTIWPAIAADPAHPVEATGWVLKPGASLSFRIPDHWDVRIWARTGCSFDAAGNGHCLTGDCGHFQCGSTWGEFPSTLGEFNLNAWNGMDFYDVSLVEGNNLPMWINSYGGSSKDRIDAKGCSAAGCTRDANATCPAKLQRIRNGHVVACLSACLVFRSDRTCCTGAYAARPACVPSSWPVDSAAVFKRAEPFAYSYVNDDATSVLTCSGECGYRVTWGVSP
ncbi:thaumatin family protein [Actinacidiphila cocklensis]|uniref:thaumatin family protein n=1 Tax=Actinacidiphila cocklensis TaxID=887465 RepID=UPI00235E6B94|nr:thaumatin family protein [Actinacidiphila cocklensis]